MSESVVSIGIDLGGTKIEAAALERAPICDANAPFSFKILKRERIPTYRERGYESIVESTAELIVRTAEATHLDLERVPVGVGMPGVIARDVVKNCNIVCLNGRPFHRDLMKRLHKRIEFENDANCFALAEARLGAARAYGHGVVFGVIMGSGVGGGVVLGGRGWSGPQRLAGEWGHHAVGPWWESTDTRQDDPPRVRPKLGARPACYCGKRGCLELYASGIAIEEDYRRRTGKSLALADIARRGAADPDATAALDEFLEAFSRGLANVIDILDPSAIVLGGGVSNLDMLYTEGVARVARYVFNDELTTPILKHELGDSAGVLGAALLDEGSSTRS